METMDVFEAIYTSRSLRRFKPDPVPPELITKVLDAAIRAPTASNNQHWIFVVVRDAERRRKVGEIYRKSAEVVLKLYQHRQPPMHMNQREQTRLMASAGYLFEHMGDAPVLLFACLKQIGMAESTYSPPPEIQAAMKPMARTAGASIYPAVQNIILACRAIGLGTVLTTIHTFYEDEIKSLLELPPEIQTYALMPIGFPQGKFGPVKRMPVHQVTVMERWGQPWPTIS